MLAGYGQKLYGQNLTFWYYLAGYGQNVKSMPGRPSIVNNASEVFSAQSCSDICWANLEPIEDRCSII
jgi:hypothetical protein